MSRTLSFHPLHSVPTAGRQLGESFMAAISLTARGSITNTLSRELESSPARKLLIGRTILYSPLCAFSALVLPRAVYVSDRCWVYWIMEAATIGAAKFMPGCGVQTALRLSIPSRRRGNSSAIGRRGLTFRRASLVICQQSSDPSNRDSLKPNSTSTGIALYGQIERQVLNGAVCSIPVLKLYGLWLLQCRTTSQMCSTSCHIILRQSTIFRDISCLMLMELLRNLSIRRIFAPLFPIHPFPPITSESSRNLQEEPRARVGIRKAGRT